MIRINLLPAREARRRVELRHQVQAAIVAVLVVVGGSRVGPIRSKIASLRRVSKSCAVDGGGDQTPRSDHQRGPEV
mgnify:CR=1 FL=1